MKLASLKIGLREAEREDTNARICRNTIQRGHFTEGRQHYNWIRAIKQNDQVKNSIELNLIRLELDLLIVVNESSSKLEIYSFN